MKNSDSELPKKRSLRPTNKIEEFKDKMELINKYLEDRRKDEEEKRNPIQHELDRLDNSKADKLEFFDLKNKVDELQQVIDSFNEEEDDEDDDVDSVEEDVLHSNYIYFSILLFILF